MSLEDCLEFRLLKYILALAEAGTFTAAAENLHVAQSALSTQIGDLETILKIKIFDRSRGNALTPEGAILAGFAHEVLQSRSDVIAAIQAVRTGTLLPLRLGFSFLIERDLLNAVMQTYKKLLPNCDIDIAMEKTDDLLERVRDGSLDTALVTLPVGSDEFHVQILTKEPLRVCLRGDDPVAQTKAVPASALNNKLSIFAYPGNHRLAHTELLRALEALGVTLRTSKPTLKMDHVQLLVEQGQCYALVRESRKLLDGLVSRPISGVDWTIDSVIISKTDRQHPALPLLYRELAKRFGHSSGNGAQLRAITHKTAQRETARSADRQLGLFVEQNTLNNRGYLQKR